MNWFHDLFIEEAKPALERHSGGGEPINNQDKTITQNGTYTADEGFTGLGTVSVNVVREDQTDIEAMLNGVISRSVTEVSSNVTNIGSRAFADCSELTIADFPIVTDLGQYAFYRCSKLITVNLPMATNIGSDAFNGCSNLITANLPMVTNIGSNAFDVCSALTTVNCPVVTVVGNSAFYKCSTLTKVDFPVVNSIGTYAFYGCGAITTLILRSETMVTLGGTSAFNNTPIKYGGTGYIYVPRALVDSYKSATNWSTFASRFRALEAFTVDGTITGELDSMKI